MEARRGPPNSRSSRVVTTCAQPVSVRRKHAVGSTQRTVVLTAAVPDQRAADSTGGKGKKAPRYASRRNAELR